MCCGGYERGQELHVAMINYHVDDVFSLITFEKHF